MSSLEEQVPLPIPLTVHPDVSRTLQSLATCRDPEQGREDLGKLLQQALELEFATIPLYLSAALSLDPKLNENIYQLIMRIAKEEMLHMTVVANLMNAIGVTPDIIKAAPGFPYKLRILDPEAPLELNLTSFSKELVRTVFMQIEAPEDPVDYEADGGVDEGPQTIGQFYEKIIQIIKDDTIPDLFEGARDRLFKQVKVRMRFEKIRYKSDSDQSRYPLPSDIDFVICCKFTACRHLEWLVSEGEGSSPFNPLDDEGLPGHYYRFRSILRGRYLVKKKDQEDYSYSGGSLPLDEEGVTKFVQNAKAKDFKGKVKAAMEKFNSRYCDILVGLEIAFTSKEESGVQEAYENALIKMAQLKSDAKKVLDAAKDAECCPGLPLYPGKRADVPVR